MGRHRAGRGITAACATPKKRQGILKQLGPNGHWGDSYEEALDP